MGHRRNRLTRGGDQESSTGRLLTTQQHGLSRTGFSRGSTDLSLVWMEHWDGAPPHATERGPNFVLFYGSTPARTSPLDVGHLYFSSTYVRCSGGPGAHEAARSWSARCVSKVSSRLGPPFNSYSILHSKFIVNIAWKKPSSRLLAVRVPGDNWSETLLPSRTITKYMQQEHHSNV